MTQPATKTPIDRSKTLVCRFSCGYETTWPAARGRQEAARHNGHAPALATVPSISSQSSGEPAGKSRQFAAPAKMDRLLDGLRKQHDGMLQALKKASLLVLAERDLRAREAEQVKGDLSAIYEVLERPVVRRSWRRGRRRPRCTEARRGRPSSVRHSRLTHLDHESGRAGPLRQCAASARSRHTARPNAGGRSRRRRHAAIARRIRRSSGVRRRRSHLEVRGRAFRRHLCDIAMATRTTARSANHATWGMMT
jgi:hypothetical protein